MDVHRRARLGETERNPLKMRQLGRLCTPRTSAKALGRGTDTRHGVRAGLLHGRQLEAQKHLGSVEKRMQKLKNNMWY